MHNLYLDIFYIPDPSLVFIGVPYFSATFSLFEFQAIAVARLLSGKANLPPEPEMKKEYEERIREKGVGKVFHSLLGQGREVAYVNTLVELVNRGIDGNGVAEQEKMKGHSENWHAARKEFERKMQQSGALINKAPEKLDLADEKVVLERASHIQGKVQGITA